VKQIGIIVMAAAFVLSAAANEAAAAPLSAKDREAIEVHRLRSLERSRQRSYQQQSDQIEQQRSRPIPPKSPNSQVVPNR